MHIRYTPAAQVKAAAAPAHSRRRKWARARFGQYFSLYWKYLNDSISSPEPGSGTSYTWEVNTYLDIEEGVLIEDYIRQLNNDICRTIRDKRLFVTEAGYVAVGRVDIQVGDFIYVLAGIPVPCVLHPTEISFIHTESQKGIVVIDWLVDAILMEL